MLLVANTRIACVVLIGPLAHTPSVAVNGSNTRILVCGPSTASGKSTISLGLLGALLESGFAPSDLAYIKPATQGVQATLTAKFCESKGIAYRHIGPLVFYRGFTKNFLDGETDSTESMQKQIAQSVEDISKGKAVTIIDGVGYPAVGSIVGVSNRDIAKCSKAAVLLVGKEGLGDAIDSYNLCKTYIMHTGVPVIGAVFNRISQGLWKKTTEGVPKYFRKFARDEKAYGFIPEDAVFKANHDDYAPAGQTNMCFIQRGTPSDDLVKVDPCSKGEVRLVDALVGRFVKAGVDVSSIVSDARKACSRAYADGPKSWKLLEGLKGPKIKWSKLPLLQLFRRQSPPALGSVPTAPTSSTLGLISLFVGSTASLMVHRIRQIAVIEPLFTA